MTSLEDAIFLLGVRGSYSVQPFPSHFYRSRESSLYVRGKERVDVIVGRGGTG
jgi:hypothetical protein